MRDLQPRRRAGNADQQTISWSQGFFIELNTGIQDARLVRRINLQAGIVRRRQHMRAALFEMIDHRDAKRRAFFRISAGADFVQENKCRTRCGQDVSAPSRFAGLDHRSDIRDMRSKRRKIRGQRLMIADVRQD